MPGDASYSAWLCRDTFPSADRGHDFFGEGGFETEAEGDIVIVIRGHMEIWAFWQEQLYI